MTGRLILADEQGRRALTKAIALGGLVLVIPAILEGIAPAWIYGAVYGPHPFALDGVARYVGYRPSFFFEHGNQYGMWISMAALVSVHGLLAERQRTAGGVAIAAVLTLCAIASQSIGAILLLAGGAWSLLMSPRNRRRIMMAAAVLSVLGGAAYLSGQVPLRTWARETSAGQAVSKVLHITNRGSLGWRVQRDQKSLALIHRAPLTGYGTWDWWRPVKSHPWGLPLLIAGQFGLPALILAAFALLAAPLREIWRGSGDVLPLVVVLAAIDSWLNSAAYIPAILAAAAIVALSASRKSEARRGGDPMQDLENAHA